MPYLPAPGDPRKSLGDLAELTESVRKNGIMQNLTVIPVEEKPGDYYTLIGNRRQEAAKLAGLESLPCRIVRGLDRREQLSIMLEENMQRTDLTISEQAQGFQMMLDLGETEESIAEKTGFSRTTIRHRLNIAKLNQKELQKKEQDTSFQLTMKDLYELEKVKDIKTRNRILKEAATSRDLVYRAQSAVSEAKRKSSERVIARLLEKLNVEKAPDGANTEIYGGKWRTVMQFDLEEDPPGEITLPEHDCQLYYLTSYRTLRVIRKAPNEEVTLNPIYSRQHTIR